jgi:hypothetical protein
MAQSLIIKGKNSAHSQSHRGKRGIFPELEESDWGTAVTLGVTRVTLCTVKKSFAIFPPQAGMSPTKLSLDENNLIIPVQGEFGR